MTETEAAWVREHVWPAAYREIDASYPNGFFGMCSCELGICGACDGTSDHGHARHDRCLSRQHGRPIIGSEASLTDGRAFVVGPSLWRADGPPCRYICACPCPKTGLAEPPSRPRPAPGHTPASALDEPGGQLDLFGAAV